MSDSILATSPFGNMTIEVGAEIPQWANITCQGCGNLYLVTRTRPKVHLENAEYFCEYCEGFTEGAREAEGHVAMSKIPPNASTALPDIVPAKTNWTPEAQIKKAEAAPVALFQIPSSPKPPDAVAGVKTGWQCPICLRVWSPIMVECLTDHKGG